MEIIAIPEELTSAPLKPITVLDYRTSKECSKQKISLTQHAFSFLLEGQKEVITDSASFSIQNSSFLMMKSGHCLMTEKLSPSPNKYRSILLFFSMEEVFGFLRKHPLPNKKKHTSQSVYAFQYDSFIQTFVKSLIDLNQSNPETQQKLIHIKFEELILYLLETKGSSFLHSLIQNTDNQIQNFLKVVENNQLNKLTLKELAFLANMSVSTFKREFEKHYKESPIKWFQDKRLHHASFLLKEEAKRPSDIYDEIGYESLSNFIQAYKAKFGKTPKQHQLD